MTEDRKQKAPAMNRWMRWGIAAIAIFLLYLAAGFWIAPPLIKPRIEEELSRRIGRKVTVAALKLNPILFTATTTRLTIHEVDGEPFAGFEELFIDAELSSILKWAATFKEIRVLAPFGVLKILPEKRLNIDDILAKFSAPSEPSDPDTALPPAIIAVFQVQDGRFTIENRTGTKPVRQLFFPITFSTENLSTLKAHEGAYAFSGIGSSGGQYTLNGRVSVNPVRVQGSYAMTGARLDKLWQHIEDVASFQITGGTIGGSGSYTLEVVESDINARLQNDTFDIKDFTLTEKGRETVLISLPKLAVQGVDADLTAREVTVARVETAGARILTWLAPDGTMKLQSVLLPDLQKLLEMKKTFAETPEAPEAPAWQASVNTVEVTDWGAAVEDRTLPTPARFTLDDIRATIENLTLQKGAQAGIAAEMRLNQSGTVRVNGTAGIDPLSADLKVVSEKIALKDFQPYVDTAVNARIEAGATGSEGRIQLREESGQVHIRYQGGMRLDNLKIQGTQQAEDFIELLELNAGGIDLQLQPNRLYAEKISIRRPSARVTIDRNGAVNVIQAFTPLQQQESAEPNLLRRLVDFLILQIKGPMPMAVDLVDLIDFRADFVDASITPTYTTRLDIHQGTVRGISSEPSARADFTVAGAIDQSAAIESAGQMNPMNAFQYTEVDFSLKDFDLPPVSPYSGKYIGYKIANGKLHLKLSYRVDTDQIDGDNKIYVDQLELGEKVKSPDALKLPVALGVAILKDENNRIQMEVPVDGNIQDPKFNIGRAVTSALTKKIDDAGTSPFSTIAEIDGFKGEELRFIAFEPGESVLSQRASKKLNALAGFLKRRKAIQLGVQGTASPQVDLAEPQPPSDLKKQPAPQPEGEQQALKALAQQRADQVKAYLSQQGNIAPKRIRLKPARVVSTAKQQFGSVELFLSSQ
jgi:outer membrane protein OmpA-like peptidoglycan-associated protein